jgi:hypothetical protein
MRGIVGVSIAHWDVPSDPHLWLHVDKVLTNTAYYVEDLQEPGGAGGLRHILPGRIFEFVREALARELARAVWVRKSKFDKDGYMTQVRLDTLSLGTRTPLTLMLDPIADLAEEVCGAAATAEQLAAEEPVIHDNELPPELEVVRSRIAIAVRALAEQPAA